MSKANQLRLHKATGEALRASGASGEGTLDPGGRRSTHLDSPLAKVAHADRCTPILHEARVVLEGKQERRELVFVRAEVGRGDQAEDDDDAAVRGRINLNGSKHETEGKSWTRTLCGEISPRRTCWSPGH